MSADENYEAAANIIREVLKEQLGYDPTHLQHQIAAALDEVHLIAGDTPDVPSALEARVKALEDIVRDQVTKHVFTHREMASSSLSAAGLQSTCTCGWSHERSIYPGHIQQDRVSVGRAIVGDERAHLRSEGVK